MVTEFGWRRQKTLRIALVTIGVLIFLVGAVVGSNLVVTQLDAERLDLSQSSVESSALVVEDYDPTYDGTTVTAVDVVVNNTDGTNDIQADIEVSFEHGGTSTGSGSVTATVTAGATETITVTVTDTDVTNIDTIDVTVVET